MKKIDTVTPYFFNDHLIIALHSGWIKKFNGIPNFDVFIEKKRLILKSATFFVGD